METNTAQHMYIIMATVIVKIVQLINGSLDLRADTAAENHVAFVKY